MSVIAVASAVPAGEAWPEQTFEAVAIPDAGRLYWLALSILRDEGEAEDAVQETLLKAWRSWGSVAVMERPASWLTRVCVNHCISRRRHLRSRGWPPLGLIEDAMSGGDPGAAADVVDIDRAYRRLSLRQRAAITLNYRHGYSVEECAVFMGCRPGTVRAHLARGLATLRKELGNG
jgi:RNA polymerase sigma factor (sigma-70 family)